MKQAIAILKLLALFLTHPDEAWRGVSARDTDRRAVDDMLRDYYFPLLGGGAAGLFIAEGWGVTPFGWDVAIRGGATLLIAYFAGCYLATFLVRELCKTVCETATEPHRVTGFVAYSMSFILAVEIITGCFPSMKFLSVICLYIIYIIWCGAHHYLLVREDMRLRFSIFASLIIVLAPYAIRRILTWIER